MDAQTIINAIRQRVESSKIVKYSDWRVGLAHDPEERKDRHKDEGRRTRHWQQWKADSYSVAKEIEAFFINEKRMSGKIVGDLDPRKAIYVYIF